MTFILTFSTKSISMLLFMTLNEEQIESKELHEKVSTLTKNKFLSPMFQVIMICGKLTICSEDTGRQSGLSGGFISRQVSMVSLVFIVHSQFLFIYLDFYCNIFWIQSYIPSSTDKLMKVLLW